MLFFLLLMLLRSICHQVSNQADKFDLLAIILLFCPGTPERRQGRGEQKKSWGQYKLMKNKKLVTNYQARRLTRKGSEGLVSPEKMFAPPWKNVLDIV